MPGTITPGNTPGTPNPPNNRAQDPNAGRPGAPGVIVTIPLGKK